MLPPDLAPSLRCPYGRQEYVVSAWAEDVDGKSTVSKNQSITLVSSGDYVDGASPLLDVVTYNNSLGVSTFGPSP